MRAYLLMLMRCFLFVCFCFLLLFFFFVFFFFFFLLLFFFFFFFFFLLLLLLFFGFFFLIFFVYLAENLLRCQIDNSCSICELSPWPKMYLFPLILLLAACTI